MITLDIAINRDHHRTLWIANTEEPVLHEFDTFYYKIAFEQYLQTMYEGKPRHDLPNWDSAYYFQHTRGDGLITCIRKGLEAYEANYVS